MRYLIAMIAAIALALPASMFVSTPVANWVVSLFSFDSPDTVGDLHAFAFMASNVAALAIGNAQRALAWNEQRRLRFEETVRRGTEQVSVAGGAVLVGPEVLGVVMAH